jgi:osmotically-inducible protein OsmY
VCRRLTDCPDVDASEVEVTVTNGEVTLMGGVDDRPQKRLAEECAWDIGGVREVHNNLRVQHRERTEGGRTGMFGGIFNR